MSEDSPYLRDAAAFRATIRSLEDAEILAQIVGQSCAFEALGFLLRMGCTEEHCRRLRDQLIENQAAIMNECVRRHIPTTST